jgi:hypothetical protein
MRLAYLFALLCFGIAGQLFAQALPTEGLPGFSGEYVHTIWRPRLERAENQTQARKGYEVWHLILEGHTEEPTQTACLLELHHQMPDGKTVHFVTDTAKSANYRLLKPLTLLGTREIRTDALGEACACALLPDAGYYLTLELPEKDSFSFQGELKFAFIDASGNYHRYVLPVGFALNPYKKSKPPSPGVQPNRLRITE